jgi:hypothetical protein
MLSVTALIEIVLGALVLGAVVVFIALFVFKVY